MATPNPIELTDPRFDATREPNALDRFFMRYIKDRRDLPFIYLTISASLVLFPFAVYLYVRGTFPWWLGLIYFAVNFKFFFDRFILMLHNTSHRTLFKRQYRLLNYYIPWVLGPFCGETPDTYYVHHITMHHAENNLDRDLSSTMRYQRDSFLHFMAYFLRFFFLGFVELARYQWGRRNHQLVRRVLTGELGFYILVVVLAFVNLHATFWVFILPFIAARFLMMAGNWAQHAFLDASDPGNSYRNSITCINTGYNRRCFNDGYHIGHHVRPTRHWTDMPADFERDIPKYRENGSIIFRNLDYFIIWLLLMTGRYRVLARHFVDLSDTPRSEDEIVALLRERTRRISEDVLPRDGGRRQPATAG